MEVFEKTVKCVKGCMEAASEAILSYYKSGYTVTLKDDENPVTEADLASHDILTSGLQKCLPRPVMSEEDYDRSVTNSSDVWLIDPLDGTKDFIKKTGDFSIMVALMEQGVPVAGFVYVPLTKKFYYGMKGKGSYLDDGGVISQLQVSREKDVRKQHMFMSRFHLRKPEVRLKDSLAISNVRQMGSSGLKICSIAEGSAHIYINSSSKTGTWDVAAGKVILEEAGGIITDIQGKELVFDQKQPYNKYGFLASTNNIHEQLIAELAKGS